MHHPSIPKVLEENRLFDKALIKCILDDVAQMYHIKLSNENPVLTHHPGCNPISLDDDTLTLLAKNKDDYMGTEKTDGIKLSLVMGTYNSMSPSISDHIRGTAYSVLIDRGFTIYQTRVICQSSFFKNSLLEGELVYDTKTKMHIFYVFDCICLNGLSMFMFPYSKRIERAIMVLDYDYQAIVSKNTLQTKDVLKRLAIKDSYLFCVTPGVQFKTKKNFSTAYLDLLCRYVKTLPHKSDGLIFTRMSAPCKRGRATEGQIIKWKFHDSIDLFVLLQLDDHNNHPSIELAYLSSGVQTLCSMGELAFKGNNTQSCMMYKIDLTIQNGTEWMKNISDKVKILYEQEMMQQNGSNNNNNTETRIDDKTNVNQVPKMYSFIVEFGIVSTTLIQSNIVSVQLNPYRVRTDKIDANDKVTIERTISGFYHRINLDEIKESFSQ